MADTACPKPLGENICGGCEGTVVLYSEVLLLPLLGVPTMLVPACFTFGRSHDSSPGRGGWGG